MICQDCKKREAQVHLTQIINNEKLSLSLCKECASDRGFHSPLENIPFPLAEILSGLAKSMGPGMANEADAALTCPQCNLNFEEFTKQGRFGCGACYQAFRPRLEGIMRKIHGASLHRGQAPTTLALPGPEVNQTVREEERLESELRRAIEQEDFERAVELRDKLRMIKEQLSLQESK
jgi:protein arginine kinase activator